jgi:hypothetical protein
MLQPDKDLTVTEVAHPCLPKWRKRIDEAEKRGAFDLRDDEDSANWNLCAIGEARRTYNVPVSVIGIHATGRPLDSRLRGLGLIFSKIVSVGSRQFDPAKRIITQIENRLAVLTR